MLGYRDALEKHGIPFREDNALRCPFSFEGGDNAVRELLARNRSFDALICGNDSIAIGAMHRLLHSGLRVPEDIKVLGWDDSPEGRYSNPSLTTVAMNVPAIAQAAVEAVLTGIDGKGASRGKIIFDHQLIIRESTGGMKNSPYTPTKQSVQPPMTYKNCTGGSSAEHCTEANRGTGLYCDDDGIDCETRPNY